MVGHTGPDSRVFDEVRQLGAGLATHPMVQPLVPSLPAGAEAVRRGDGDESLLFVLNHTQNEVTVPLFRSMTDLLDSKAVPADTLTLGKYGVAMLR